MALQLRPKLIILRNQGLVHRFSSSSSDNHKEDKNDPQSPPSSETKSSMSSYFSDVKASLSQTSTSPLRRLSQQSPIKEDSPSSTPSQPPKVASLSEIRKNLSDFRATPLSSDKTRQSSKPVLFQDLYKRNTVNVETDRSDRSDRSDRGVNSGNEAFSRIRESLRQIRSSTANRLGGPDMKNTGVLDLKEFKGSLNVKTTPVVMGGSDSVPSPFQMGRKDAAAAGGGGDANDELRNDLSRTYTYADLGEQLHKLRPVDTPTKKVGLSLTELNERLIKLRKIEMKRLNTHLGGMTFGDLKQSLQQLANDDGKSKKPSLQGMDILGNIGGTSTYMLDPPKEELVEKYFHPDNMSSAEKLKLELKKVRDEFKMSESDCGSSRVQVAQLTTKIKHLSSVLHKKDKHSRKGLQEMVQRRKKLLKYLRRTDWDSYCFCLSKLGLRDNPDYKS